MKYSILRKCIGNKKIIQKTAMPAGSIFIVNTMLFFTGILKGSSAVMLLQNCLDTTGGKRKRKKATNSFLIPDSCYIYS